MTKRSRNQKGPSTKHSRYLPDSGSGDQAAQRPSRGGDDNRYAHVGGFLTRYTIHGTNVPHAVEHAPGSMQQTHLVRPVAPFEKTCAGADVWPSYNPMHKQARGGSPGPVDGEPPQAQYPNCQAHLVMDQAIAGIEEQDPFLPQTSRMQSSVDPNCSCVVLENNELTGQSSSQDGMRPTESRTVDNTPMASAWPEYDFMNFEKQDDTMSDKSLDLDNIADEVDIPTPGLRNLVSNPMEPVGSHTQPWTTYNSNGSGRQLEQDVNMLFDHIQASDTCRSASNAVTTQSSYVVVHPPETSSMSSVSQGPETMANSGLMIRAAEQQAWASDEGHFSYGNPHQSNPNEKRPDPASADSDGADFLPGAANRGLLSPRNTGLPYPAYETNVCDNAASTTTSMPSAPDSIRCGCCEKVFTGKFRLGNLARHKRHKHDGAALLDCLEHTCNKVFKRQDARLKHVRKHHAGLASVYIPRPDQRRYRSEQNYALNNVGSRF